MVQIQNCIYVGQIGTQNIQISNGEIFFKTLYKKDKQVTSCVLMHWLMKNSLTLQLNDPRVITRAKLFLDMQGSSIIKGIL